VLKQYFGSLIFLRKKRGVQSTWIPCLFVLGTFVLSVYIMVPSINIIYSTLQIGCSNTWEVNLVLQSNVFIEVMKKHQNRLQQSTTLLSIQRNGIHMNCPLTGETKLAPTRPRSSIFWSRRFQQLKRCHLNYQVLTF
jgi:hypothetical protein